MSTAEIDEDLVSGLKTARTKRMYFAVVLKGGTDGALMVSKQKIPPTDIAAAKKKTGGSAALKGACFVEDGTHIFEIAKVPPATLSAAIKKIAKRDAGMTLKVECRMGTSDDLLDDDDKAAAAKAAAAQQAMQDTAGPLPETAKYETAYDTWLQSAGVALSAVERLVSSLESTGDEVAQAIANVIKDLQHNFPDTLDDALTGLVQAAQSGKASEAEGFRVKAEIAIKASLAFLNNNAETIKACEDNPFGINVPFRAELTDALKQVLVNVKATVNKPR